MGLLDVLNGMQNGPRGPSTPSDDSRGGMSPMTIAMLALLGYKAFKSFTGGQAAANPAGPGALPGGSPVNTGIPGSTGGLGDLLPGGLGNLFGGRDAGSALSGGLNDLLKQFQQNGHGEVASSWVGSGPNKAIAPNDLAKALGADRINSLMTQSGMSRDELLSGLSQQLPDVVDQLTPDGRLPTGHEAARLI
jgi:uncharacterized protein YidB (DUF937 family)